MLGALAVLRHHSGEGVVPELYSLLASSGAASDAAAHAIMTTDTVKKEFAAEVLIHTHSILLPVGGAGVGIPAVSDNGPDTALFQVCFCYQYRCGFHDIFCKHRRRCTGRVGDDQRHILLVYIMGLDPYMQSRRPETLRGAHAAGDSSVHAAAAKAIGCAPEEVLVASTGVIGQTLKVEAIENGVPELYSLLASSGAASDAAAHASAGDQMLGALAVLRHHSGEGVADLMQLHDEVYIPLVHFPDFRVIMTTDTVKKEFAAEVLIGGKPVRIGGIAKGSGMIHPFGRLRRWTPPALPREHSR